MSEMMQDLSNVTADDASPAPVTVAPTHRDVQRAALRELVILSSDCTAAEAKIEAEHEAAVKLAKETFDKDNWRTEERYKKLENETRQKYQERLEKIASHFQAETKSLKESVDAIRRRVAHEKDSTDRDVKTQYEQAAWLAESVLEAAQIKARTELKQAKEQYESRIEQLDSLETQTSKLIKVYGHSLPAMSDKLEPEDQKKLDADPAVAFNEWFNASRQYMAIFESLKLPGLFVGGRPYVAGLTLCVVTVGLTQVINSIEAVAWAPDAIALGATLAVTIVGGLILQGLTRSQVKQAYIPLRKSLIAARLAAKVQWDTAEKFVQEKLEQAEQKCKVEVHAAKDKFTPVLTQAAQNRDASLKSLDAKFSKQTAHLNEWRDRKQTETEELLKQNLAEIQAGRERDLHKTLQQYEQKQADIEKQYKDNLDSLLGCWTEGLARIQAPIEEEGEASAKGRTPRTWDDPAWKQWTPPKVFAPTIRFGEMKVDIKQITDQTPKRLALPPTFDVPALLAFPRQSSLLICTDHEGRAEALRTLQMVMVRLLTNLPAGRVHFTIIDPVGLGQNFAGFMHLADHDEALVGGRIWTEQEHIEQRLADLTEHMETVIQKYLRNEFETIDDYNAQAGELAEPYRFLVIADFPTSFEGDAFRRLCSIATSGARCGVYTLIVRDMRQTVPADAHWEELLAHAVNIVRADGKFTWKDEVFQKFPLVLDEPPTEEFLTDIMEKVGKQAKESKRVEVSFDSIAPASSDKFWTETTSSDLHVPVGRCGATRLQSFRLGRGMAQHALIAGKTGSGKSTLLNAIITNVAMWYSPDEVEFYLVDFKKGVEFKAYATAELPHARAIAVESDREFGLSVLQRLDAELTRRGNLYRKIGVQDLASYRKATGEKMPRTLLIIDEFQEFFSEDDKIGQDAALLMDRLVRQGRAFGIHLILGSQTIGGTSGLSRSTIGQMAVRVALQCNEADSQLILGDNNSAARLLTRPGEAIYNDAGGLVENNSPFQIAWLPDAKREEFLASVHQKAVRELTGRRSEPPIVFEGNAPAEIRKNHQLINFLESPKWPAMPAAPQAWMGDPVAIKDPTGVTFRRQSGANLLIVGQQDESAVAIMQAALISLAAQHAPQSAQFYILDGSAADSPLLGQLEKAASILPHKSQMVEYRLVPDVINELAEEMKRRQTEDANNAPSVFVMVYGLQRYRMLRRQEDDFSFSRSSDEEAKPKTDKQFADLLREGPNFGIHILTWVDTPISLERTLDRGSMREFDNRILFQMSAGDSSNLIDSPLANKLGFHRALAYSEEQGLIEKFRPYAMANQDWLDFVKSRFGNKQAD